MSLTKVSYSMIKGAYVNVLDFGATPVTTGLPTVDSTAAIQAALDYVTSSDNVNGTAQTVFIPAGKYLVTAPLRVPSVTRVIGAGKFQTELIADAGFVGASMMTDKGSAAKIQIEHIRFYSAFAPTTITDVIKLGYGIAFGTEGRLYELIIRGATAQGQPMSARAINIVGNVAYLGYITVEYCGTGIYEGPNSVANSYEVCTVLGMDTYGFYLNTGARLVNCHMEAPTATATPYYVGRSAGLVNCDCSVGAGTTIAQIVYLDPGAIGIDVTSMVRYLGVGAVTTHILNDQRTISSDNPYWADTATETGVIYTFRDARYIRVGRAGYITYDANYSPQFAGKAAKGANYAEMLHEGAVTTAAVRIDGTNNRFYPGVDNAVSLGYSARRWTVVYATTGTINTSDIRAKQQIRDINEAEQAVAKRCKKLLRAYKFNDAVKSKGDKARIHFGIMAQELEAAFVAEGLNAFDYGVICHDFWDAEFDADGKEILAAGDQYAIRYDELLAFIIAAM